MAIVLGLDAKLLRGTAGATGATEVKNVKVFTLKTSKRLLSSFLSLKRVF